jgi:hypothetical protein
MLLKLRHTILLSNIVDRRQGLSIAKEEGFDILHRNLLEFLSLSAINP